MYVHRSFDVARQLIIRRLSLVPRMTPILRNRHEKVQEASINLIGRIGTSTSPLSRVADRYS